MPADPKQEARIVDPVAVRAARLSGDECAACAGPPSNVHHVIPRGEGGDDVAANLLLLCGSGTMGCHGAWHGNPYTAYVINVSGESHAERRNRDWVAVRVGRFILDSREDTLAYVLQKLGWNPGVAYLQRVYWIDPEKIVAVG